MRSRLLNSIKINFIQFHIGMYLSYIMAKLFNEMKIHNRVSNVTELTTISMEERVSNGLFLKMRNYYRMKVFFANSNIKYPIKLINNYYLRHFHQLHHQICNSEMNFFDAISFVGCIC